MSAMPKSRIRPPTRPRQPATVRPLVKDLPELFTRLNQVLATSQRIAALDDRGTGRGAIVSGPVFERFTMAAIRVLSHVDPEVVRTCIKGYFPAWLAGCAARVLYDAQKPELFAMLLGLNDGHTITTDRIAEDLALTPAKRKKAITLWPTSTRYADEVARYVHSVDSAAN
jgi:hypothetical protein